MAVALLCTQLGKIEFDSGFDTLGIKEDKYIEARKEVDATFNRNQKIAVEVAPKEGNFLDIQEDMELWEKELNAEFDTIHFKSWIKALSLLYSNKDLEEKSREEILQRYSEIELFQNLVADDKSSFLVLIEFPKFDEKTILEKFDKARKNTNFKLDYSFNITSRFHIEEAVDTSIVRDVKRIIGFILLFFIGIMFIAYRRFFGMFYLVCIVLISMIGALVVYSFSGLALNLITILVLPVMIVLASADAIHLITGFYAQDPYLSTQERVRNVYHKYFTPSLLTSLTTSVAFFSLMFNKTESVYTLGWMTGSSVLIAFILCFTISPFIFRLAKARNIQNHSFLKLSKFFIDRRKIFSFFFIPLILLAIILLPKLTYKNNFEIFLPTKAQATLEHDLIRDNFSSTATMDILIHLADSTGSSSIIQTLADNITNLDHVAGVKCSQTKSIFLTKFMIPVDFAAVSGYSNRFSANDKKTQRIQVSVKDPNKIIPIEQQLKQLLKDQSLSDYTISSSALIYNNVNKEVGKSLFRSLLSSSIFLFLIFVLLTRSAVLAAIGLFANLVPLSLIVIIFIVFDLHINILTAMTAVVCLGIIVDDTIHSFYRRVILRETFKELGFGMLTTTLLLMLGFGIFCISDVKPIAIFGSVAAAVFLVTLLSDLSLLLYLIDLYDRYFGKKMISDGIEK